MKNRDSADRAMFIRALALSLPLGMIVGALLGGSIAERAGWTDTAATAASVIGMVILAPLSAYGGVYVAGKIASFGRLFYNPSGRSTPAKPGYSYAESLAVRGKIEEAIAAYEKHCIGAPEEAEPHIRIAWLLTDELGRHEQAINRLERAREMGDSSASLAASREIVDIYSNRLGDPRRAMPELARLAQQQAGTEHGEWARKRLRELKDEMGKELKWS